MNNTKDILHRLGIEKYNAGACSGPDRWSGSESSGTIDSVNPATNSLIASVYKSSEEDYEGVMRTSVEAFKVWRMVPAPKRGEMIRLLAEELRKNKDFANKISSILENDVREKQELDSQLDVYAEESIYKKFATSEDNAVMSEFHKADWKDKFSIIQRFKDDRMQYFGKKILYEESPQSLPKNEYEVMHKEIASRILSTNEEKWNTIPRTYSEIDTLRNKFKDDKEKLKALQDINLYIEEIEKMYQKAC